MHEAELFLVFARPLRELGIPYMVTGSVASILYGEPRLTHDIDLVLELGRERLTEFCAAFPIEEFYCPPPEVIRSELIRSSRGHFNLIHHASGFKGDIYLVGNDPLHAWGMGHVRNVDLDGEILSVAPPEYVIIRKLEYFEEGGSEKHLRDITAMLELQMQEMDTDFIKQSVRERGLEAAWERVDPE